MKKLLAFLVLSQSMMFAYGFTWWKKATPAAEPVSVQQETTLANIPGRVSALGAAVVDSCKGCKNAIVKSVHEHPYIYAIPAVIATLVIADKLAKKYSKWYRDNCAHCFSAAHRCACSAGKRIRPKRNA